jgi:hypothetical protein
MLGDARARQERRRARAPSARLEVELEDIVRSDAANVAYVARVVGLAHGHQMDEPTRREWLRALQSKKSATFSA